MKDIFKESQFWQCFSFREKKLLFNKYFYRVVLIEIEILSPHFFMHIFFIMLYVRYCINAKTYGDTGIRVKYKIV